MSSSIQVLNTKSWTEILNRNEELIRELQSNHKDSVPPWSEVFRAFDLCPFDETRVVILGSEPQASDEANGLAFSGRTKITPSLNTLYNELKRTHGVKPTSPDLSSWAKQGVLLVNPVLSAVPGRPNVHRGIGWETIVYDALATLRDEGPQVVWVAMGAPAKTFIKSLGIRKGIGYSLIETASPSPLANGEVLGSDLFKRIDTKVRRLGHEPIKWID